MSWRRVKISNLGVASCFRYLLTAPPSLSLVLSHYVTTYFPKCIVNPQNAYF